MIKLASIIQKRAIDQRGNYSYPIVIDNNNDATMSTSNRLFTSKYNWLELNVIYLHESDCMSLSICLAGGKKTGVQAVTNIAY